MKEKVKAPKINRNGNRNRNRNPNEIISWLKYLLELEHQRKYFILPEKNNKNIKQATGRKDKTK